MTTTTNPLTPSQTTITPVKTPTQSSAPTAEGLFSSFNICSPSSPTSNAPPQNASNIFGTSTGFGASPQSNTSIFGGASNTENKSSIFGTTQTTQPTQVTTGQSPFGSSMPKPDQSVFGNNSNQSVFGGPTNHTAAASPFGQPQNTPSIFGGAATASTGAGSSPFGGGTTSIFGTKAPETQSSPFGQPQQTSAFSQGGSLFGGNSTFGSGGTTTGTSGFGFGQQQTQQPVFGNYYCFHLFELSFVSRQVFSFILHFQRISKAFSFSFKFAKNLN